MFCEQCGAELEENTRFCSTCGNPLSGVLSGAVWWLARSGKVQDPSGSYVLEGDSELHLELMKGGKCLQWRGGTGRPCAYSI